MTLRATSTSSLFVLQQVVGEIVLVPGFECPTKLVISFPKPSRWPLTPSFRSMISGAGKEGGQCCACPLRTPDMGGGVVDVHMRWVCRGSVTVNEYCGSTQDQLVHQLLDDCSRYGHSRSLARRGTAGCVHWACHHPPGASVQHRATVHDW